MELKPALPLNTLYMYMYNQKTDVSSPRGSPMGPSNGALAPLRGKPHEPRSRLREPRRCVVPFLSTADLLMAHRQDDLDEELDDAQLGLIPLANNTRTTYGEPPHTQHLQGGRVRQFKRQSARDPEPMIPGLEVRCLIHWANGTN